LIFEKKPPSAWPAEAGGLGNRFSVLGYGEDPIGILLSIFNMLLFYTVRFAITV
jgi:hypothetical protein